MVLDDENPLGCCGTDFGKLLSTGFSVGVLRGRAF
jgi:hypothetical protein